MTGPAREGIRGPDGLWDVVVIGGGTAGPADALMVAGDGDSVLVLDPGELPAAAPRELGAFGIRVVSGVVGSVTRAGGRFEVVLVTGERAVARRVLGPGGDEPGYEIRSNRRGRSRSG